MSDCHGASDCHCDECERFLATAGGTCASCARPYAEHGAPHAWDTLDRPSCPPPSATGTYRHSPAGAA